MNDDNPLDDGDVPERGSKLFRVTEPELAELERILPQAFWDLTLRPDATPLQRTWFRRVQTILTNIRWNYGPPTEVGIIPAGEGDDEPDEGGEGGGNR